MIKTVAKHSYIKGKNGIAKGRAHINYIAHRDGEDRERGGRKFFDKERDDIDAGEVKKVMYEKADERGVVMHKIILSPGLDADAKEYTRELMEKLERFKGQEFEWRAVVHENTDHQHVHVAVMGRDSEGHLVRFDREDHAKLRQFGDEYLDREHKLERYLDRELEDLIRSKEYERGGDEKFQQLIYGKRYEKELDDPERDRREFEELDEKLRRMFEDKRGPELYPKSHDQRTIEQAGRMAEHHGDYTTAIARERLDKIAELHPELAASIQEELNDLREAASDNRIDQRRDIELEHVLGFDPRSTEREQEATQERAAESFETDRIARPEQQDKDEDERERDDRDEPGPEY